MDCAEPVPDKNCVIASLVLELDPETNELNEIFFHDKQLIPVATVGLLIENNKLFLGTYSGNRVTRIELEDSETEIESSGPELENPDTATVQSTSPEAPAK